MKFNRALLGLAASLALAGAAQADVLTFEDLLNGSANSNVIGPAGSPARAANDPAAGQFALDDPNAPTPGAEFFSQISYHGFIFSASATGPDLGGPSGSWFYTNRSPVLNSPTLANSGPVYVSTEAVCAPNATGYCTLSDPNISVSQSIKSNLGVDFFFDGARFASQSTGVTIAYKLYKDGNQVYDGTASATILNLNSAFEAPVFIASGYAGLVDEVYVVARAGQFGMDDFTFHAAPIPEPATYGLMLAGLVGVAAVARRRKQAK